MGKRIKKSISQIQLVKKILIAEAGINHNGNLILAKKLIDLIE